MVVIDSPYLSHATEGLRHAVRDLDAVVFADVCKHGQHPLAGIVAELQGDGQLPARWQCVAALPTYNPLGSTITFTSEADIHAACTLALKPPKRRKRRETIKKASPPAEKQQ